MSSFVGIYLVLQIVCWHWCGFAILLFVCMDLVLQTCCLLAFIWFCECALLIFVWFVDVQIFRWRFFYDHLTFFFSFVGQVVGIRTLLIIATLSNRLLKRMCNWTFQSEFTQGFTALLWFGFDLCFSSNYEWSKTVGSSCRLNQYELWYADYDLEVWKKNNSWSRSCSCLVWQPSFDGFNPFAGWTGLKKMVVPLCSQMLFQLRRWSSSQTMLETRAEVGNEKIVVDCSNVDDKFLVSIDRNWRPWDFAWWWGWPFLWWKE